MGWSPTEEHLGVQTEKADDAVVPATWAGGDSGPKHGNVSLHPYKCTGLPEPARRGPGSEPQVRRSRAAGFT